MKLLTLLIILLFQMNIVADTTWKLIDQQDQRVEREVQESEKEAKKGITKKKRRSMTVSRQCSYQIQGLNYYVRPSKAVSSGLRLFAESVQADACRKAKRECEDLNIHHGGECRKAL